MFNVGVRTNPTHQVRQPDKLASRQTSLWVELDQPSNPTFLKEFRICITTLHINIV